MFDVTNVAGTGVAGALATLHLSTSGLLGLIAAVAVLLALGALAALAMSRRATSRSTLRDHSLNAPHPDRFLSCIPLAGLATLALAAGLAWLFWAGVPGLRPVVFGLGLAGLAMGGGMVVRRHHVASSTPLGLASRHPRRDNARP